MNLRLTLTPMILGLTLTLSSPAAFAAEPEATYQELAKCSAIPDASTRLACYDALMPRIRAALAAGPAELSRSDQTSLFGLTLPDIFGSSTPQAPQEFGANDMPQPPPPPGVPQPLDSITATVTEYATTPLGKFIVFLDNGQVWRQQESDGGTIHFKTKPGENKVTISRGVLGSYVLQLNGSNKIFKVNRVK
jgi:hypothetical protein